MTIFRCVLQSRFLTDVLNEITLFGRLLGVQKLIFSLRFVGGGEEGLGGLGRSVEGRGSEGKRGSEAVGDG